MQNKSNLEVMLKIANTTNNVAKAKQAIRKATNTPLYLFPVKPVQPRNYCDDQLDELFDLKENELANKWWEI